MIQGGDFPTGPLYEETCMDDMVGMHMPPAPQMMMAAAMVSLGETDWGSAMPDVAA